jgi:GTPase-associated protein 1
MSQELHYTSVPRGLLPGTRGFCTVASTPNMPGPLRERLEGLSGYQQVFPPHDPKAALNPVVFSHHRLSLGGQLYSVLSRVACAELDYTSRSNKYAHHVVLDPAERPAGGPAWLLSQPGFMEPSWRGEPRFLAAGRIPPQGEQPSGIAHAWQALTADAGWAGVLAESFLAAPHRPAFLIFEPGMEILPLFAEALALLPSECRWDVDFSTYFTKLPQGLNCAWRGVLAGSPEAKRATSAPAALVLHLSGEMDAASGGSLVEFARTGKRPGPDKAPSASGRGRTSSRKASPAAANVELSSDLAVRNRDHGREYQVIPGLQSSLGVTDELRPGKRRSGRSTRLRWWLILGSIAAALIACSSIYIYRGSATHDLIAQTSRSVAEKKAATAEEKPAAPAEAEPKKEVVASHEEAGAPKSKKPVEQVPKKEEPAVAKNPVAVAKPKPDRPPIPANQVPVAEFLALPELDQSQLGGAKILSRSYDSLKDVREVFLLFPNHDLTGKHEENSWRVIHPKAGGLEDELELAQFEFLPEAMNFHWNENALKKVRFQKLSRLLRDSVLKVETGGRTSYFMLRNPPLLSPRAMSLTRVGPQTDGIKPRHLEPPWAKDGSMQGFPWKLFVRQWRIDVFTDRSTKTRLGEGEYDALKHKEPMAAPIIPKWVDLTLAVSEHRLVIDLDFHREAIIEQTNELNELRHEAAELDLELKNRARQEDTVKRLGKLKQEIQVIEPKYKSYNLMNHNFGSELSLVIALVLDDHTVIDLARIGTFADSVAEPGK